MNPSLIITNQSILNSINPDFQILTLDNKCLFTEGPVWNKDGYYLFSDIPANVIYRIAEGRKKEVYIANSGTDNPDDPDIKKDQAGSNALAYTADGTLLICQHGSHGIAQFNGDKVTPYISDFLGRPFNSPNDFIIHSDGRIYFSDPPYGLKDGKLNPSKYQPLAGVYCWKNGKLELICDKYQYPNGVCFSPDEKTLYICSNKPFEKFVSEYDPNTNKFRKILIEETSDGIECDRLGNIYLCNKDGIIICNAGGERLAQIQLPTIPANICWGGENGNDLFVTARQNIFLIKNLQKS